MLQPININLFILYVASLFGHGYLAPAVAGAGTTVGFRLGHRLRYDMVTTLLFGESLTSKPKSPLDVGYQTTGQIDLTPIWQDPNDLDTLLLMIELSNPKLWIKSRKTPEPEGFVEHSSKFEKISASPILVLWKRGEILKFFHLARDEYISSLNFKRGLASIFQYRTLDHAYQEIDASGQCNVSYHSLGPSAFQKVKSNCHSRFLAPKFKHPNPILGVKVASLRTSTYDLTENFVPKEVVEDEIHSTTLAARPEAGTYVSSHRVLKLHPESEDRQNAKTVSGTHHMEAIIKLGGGFVEVTIELQQELFNSPDPEGPTLEEMLELNWNSLMPSALGTSKSAMAFLKLLPLVRDASVEQLTKILKSPKYADLRLQLYDLLGGASTLYAHRAATKVLRGDETGELTERYLWALSMSGCPNPDVIKEVLKNSEEVMANEKLAETYALTVASMAKNYGFPAVLTKVYRSLESGLNTCSSEDCQLRFLRAIGNLEFKSTIPTLLKYATKAKSKSISIVAWKALRKLNTQLITPEIKLAAIRTFHQMDGLRKDSSIRTLALNVILENDPTVNDLRNLLIYLSDRDPIYEVRKYLSQRLQQLSDNCPQFRKKLAEARNMIDAQKLYNYDVQALRGLSTAFNRDFLRSPASNGTLLTIQEISSGLLKRGVVEVVMESESSRQTFFSLGLYASGMGGMMTSSDQDTTNENAASAEEDETSTSGMELSLLGVDIRPFVFFQGYTELMGHAWSGTASERTTAFQILLSLHRHSELIALGCGFVAELEVSGAVSFDLAGQVQLSLWSKTAESKVDMSAGLAIQGNSKIRANFVKSMAEFSLTMEPKLELTSDVDFSGKLSLCMRLSSPETLVRHHIYKVERIPGSRHRLRKTKRLRFVAPGRSYLLNRKNNEMCSRLFS